MLGFTQPGSATTVPAGPSLDDLFNLPTSQPSGAANPFSIAWYNATQPNAPSTGGGVAAWLQANSTAVVIVAGALFALALFGGKRR